MKRLIALVCLGLPLLIVAAGVYIVIGTPEVMTEVVEYQSSHDGGYDLLLIGLLFAIVGCFAAYALNTDD